MFKRKAEDSGKTSVLQFGFKIFFIHIINVLVMIVVGMLLENLKYIKIPVSDMATPVVITTVCFILYVIMVYIESWRTGERDSNLVAYKHIVYNKFKPLYAAIVSQIPGILLSVAAFFPAGEGAAKYIKYYYLNFNYFLLTYEKTFKTVYLLPVIFPLIIAPLAYHLGYKSYRLLDKLMFVNPNKIANSKKNNKK